MKRCKIDFTAARTEKVVINLLDDSAKMLEALKEQKSEDERATLIETKEEFKDWIYIKRPASLAIRMSFGLQEFLPVALRVTPIKGPKNEREVCVIANHEEEACIKTRCDIYRMQSSNRMTYEWSRRAGYRATQILIDKSGKSELAII